MPRDHTTCNNLVTSLLAAVKDLEETLVSATSPELMDTAMCLNLESSQTQEEREKETVKARAPAIMPRVLIAAAHRFTSSKRKKGTSKRSQVQRPRDLSMCLDLVLPQNSFGGMAEGGFNLFNIARPRPHKISPHAWLAFE
eukprot:Gb_09345 [translate_table: standard]